MDSIGEILFGVAVYAAIFLIFGGLIYLAYLALRPKKELVESWRQAEMALSLTYKQPRVGYPILEGLFENYNVRLQGSPGSAGSGAGGTGRSSPPQTHYSVFHSNSKMPLLRLEVDDDFYFRGDREVGDAEFDKKFQISYAKESIVRNVFSDPALRQRIMDLNYPVIYINSEKAIVSEKGVQEEPEVMRDRLQLAITLAKAVENLQ